MIHQTSQKHIAFGRFSVYMTYISRFGDDAMSGDSFYCLIGTVDKYKNLSNIQTGQYPTFECCLLENIFYLCAVFREESCGTLHIESVFALSFQENVEVFNESKDTTDDTHSCCRQGEVCPNGHACAPFLYECGGIASFILIRVFPQPS